MDIIDNFKKLVKNWRLLVIVIWLLVGIAIIPFPDPNVSFVGIIIFLPFLVFLMFLFLLSLISKKNIFEYETWKILLFLMISLPLMLLISVVLIVLFAISVISYFFFSSWFILYGCYLLGKNVDTRISKTSKARSFLRVVIFFGGLVGALLFLYLFIIGPTIFDITVVLDPTTDVPGYLNGVYILVGGILIGLAVVCVVFMFKKSFASWFGTFAILVSVYTLFLVLKIYLGILNLQDIQEISSVWAYIGMIIPDLFIIFYSLSTLMGSQAELLGKRFKRFKLDTVIIWLILSKVTYEFIRFFPYTKFANIDFPLINELSKLNNDLINLLKNVAVLVFFLLLLIVIGIYEINKYAKETRKLNGEEDKEIDELISSQPIEDENDIILTEKDSGNNEDTEVGEESEEFNQDQTF
ncbi:MAG: hypothetical protein KGD58_07710 [Candidatus Lokiarchaeota archaeon]|nr:hypothetical protein [Candidatus Lokiarchaeota archaeon]